MAVSHEDATPTIPRMSRSTTSKVPHTRALCGTIIESQQRKVEQKCSFHWGGLEKQFENEQNAVEPQMSVQLPSNVAATFGSRGPRRIAAVSVLSLLILAGIAEPSEAADGSLRDVLRAAKCLSKETTLVARNGNTSVYEANCSDTSHRVIKIVCLRARCAVSGGVRPDEEDGR